jgi:dihydrofolate synthase/folylpolyglutamate synthase
MNYHKIHVVGTNGKGSVSKYLSDNLTKDKNRVGLFTSPHIFNFEERIKVNNENIPFLDLQDYMIDIRVKFPKYTLGFFQLMFLACLAYLETKRINVAIFESGIGAKKDVVNYLNFDTTIFTSIGIDHEKLLGKTLEKISEDKSFAIKENNKVFYPSTLNKVSEKILQERAKLVGNESLHSVKIDSKNIHTQNQELSKYILKTEFNIDAR